MSIKICDAIMGSGKSSAAINYMNAHPQQKFIYITSYLSEAARIKDACPELHFIEPNNRLPEFGFKKYRHTFQLISEGKNIASTHNMFLRYTDEMIDKIKEHNYIIIIDEAVDILYPAGISTVDLMVFERLGWLIRENGVIKISPDFDYHNGKYDEIVSLARGNRLVEMDDARKNGKLYYWLFSKELLLAFKDVYVLTYMFNVQLMRCGLDLMGLEYHKIGIRRDKYGRYLFCDYPNYIPEYTAHLSEMIHILDNDKLNVVGKGQTALSHTWFDSAGSEKKDVLRKNVENYYCNYNRDKPSKRRLWATYKNGEADIKGKGFYRSCIPFNQKATNEYIDKDVLAYCVNVFINPNVKNYLARNGIDISEDGYATSTMVQWIWRSAIREGKEVWIYLPSERMRRLLREWIEHTEQYYRNKKGANKK